MFRGQQCSDRCKNSLAILRRQEKATKLRQCKCTQDEMLGDFYCTDIKRNMEELCRDDNEEVDVAEVDNATDINDISEMNPEQTVTSEYEESLNNEINVDESPPKGRSSLMGSSVSIVTVIILLNYFIPVHL